MQLRWPWLLIVAALPLLGWWTTGLFDLDEGFYGAAASEMLRRGEWITPYYAGSPWFEKPILVYWTAIPALAIFGDQVGPRLPSVLASIGVMAMVYRFGRRHLTTETGHLAVLVLAGSLLFAAAGQMMLTDALLLLCLTGAYTEFWNSLQDPKHRKWFGLWLGLSVLAKGPVGILLFIPIALWTYFRRPESRPGFRGGWLPAAGLFAVAVCSWYVPAYLQNGQTFVQKFLIEQNLNRFLGGDEAHTVREPYMYLFFVAILLIGMFPWSLWLPKAWVLKRDRSPVEAYLACWAAVVFLFFTFSGAKLVHYILPCFPPLALIVANAISDKRRAETGAAIWVGVLAILLWIGFPIYYQSSGQAEAHAKVRTLNGTDGSAALYQIGRRERDKGTGGTRLRETSLPSLRLYLKRDAENVESLDELLALPMPVHVFTRANRISDDDRRAIEARGFALEGGPRTDSEFFATYRIAPLE